MSFIEALKENVRYFIEDSRVYWNKRGQGSVLKSFLYILTCHGWHIMFLFRLGKIIYSIPVPVISHILKIVFQLIWFFITTAYGIYIDPSSTIGKGFYIGHFGAIVIGGNIGHYCNVGQGVTIGYKGAGKSDYWPTIGDNVYVGVGAKVIGNIKLGDGCVVGANAVVIKDVPAGYMAIGVPAVLKPLKPAA